MLHVNVPAEAEPSARLPPPTLEDFLEAARNIPTELGVELDTQLPNEKPPEGAHGKVVYGRLGLGQRVAVKIQHEMGDGHLARRDANVLQLLQNCALPYPPPMLPGCFGELSQSLTHEDGTTRRWHYLVMDGDSTGNGWREWFDAKARGVSMHDAGAELILAERFVQAAVAILFMHAAGHAHHDIKLENTMLVPADSSFPWGVCVIDLGLACPLAPGESSNVPTGTPAYAAPEVRFPATHESYSHGFPSDVWSLGITLFFAATGVPPFLQAHAAADICFTKVQQAQTNGQSSTDTIFRHFNDTKRWLPPTCPFSEQLIALIDAMLTIKPAERPNITETLGLAIEWARAVLPGTDDPPWLRAATAAAAAPFDGPAAIAEAVAIHAPGSSAVPSAEPVAAAPATRSLAEPAAAAPAATRSLAEPVAAAPAMRSLSAPSKSTLTPSLTPSLAEMKAAYVKAMDEAATMSSMDEAGMGEGEAEPEMRSCSSSDGASQQGFTTLSADSAEGEPASKRPRSAAVPVLPPRFMRQNAFVLRRTPL